MKEVALLFTGCGSFRANNAPALLDSEFGQDSRLAPCTRCIRDGFSSVALLPLRAGPGIIGLLQLQDRGANRLTLDTVCYFEGLADMIGIALAREGGGALLRFRNKVLAIQQERGAAWRIERRYS